ncbi:hypothetical protein [Flectobacillus longus]|uniref:hypothetical protein n=1 Tax=Flectobacillus longus TaxID=2984207 RepID=UPI0024B72288|nr:hypothetical protein [Flectobacillus longus]MDI9879773.1 hypothetical protein [Flectobacillus longus]
MKDETYSKLTLEELKAKEKTYKVVLGALLGLQILIVILAIYLMITQKQFTFIAISGGLIPSLILTQKSLKKVQEEIKNRI